MIPKKPAPDLIGGPGFSEKIMRKQMLQAAAAGTPS